MKCGLIGEKLSHSFSPQIHKALADYSYSLFEMSEEEVGSFLKSDKFDATNVTIPYKKTVMPFLDEISEEALRIGSVNTITRTEKGLRGDNTDYYGFLYTVKKSGIEIPGKKVLILGTGGASLTARTVSADLGASEIVFVSRTGETDYVNVYEKHSDASVVINCTPVGMYPNNGTAPIELAKLPHCRGVIDMIYNPAKTKLLLDAERLGIPCINGLSMLVAQAKRACELFLGEEIADSEIDRITGSIARETGNIILVGMPGCGKSTMGRWITRLTGRPLLDSDVRVHVMCGKTPSEIILGEGEEAFRKVEHEALCEICKHSGQVIATGGGVVTRPENFDILRQHGKVFFIKRSPESLDTEDRPLSRRQKLSEMYAHRLPLYESFCDYTVLNEGDPQDCAKEILKLYYEE